MFKGVGIGFAVSIYLSLVTGTIELGHYASFYQIVLKYPMKMKNLVSVRPNYFIFVGYLKKKRGSVWGGEGRGEEGFKRFLWTPSGPSTAGRAHEIIILYPQYFVFNAFIIRSRCYKKLMLNTTKYNNFNCT